MKHLVFVGLAGSLMLSPRGKAADTEESVPYAGWAVSVLNSSIDRVPNEAGAAGVRVEDLDPNGPAVKAGVVRGDILVEFDEQRLFNTAQLRALIATLKPGESYAVRFVREGTLHTVQLGLSRRRPGSEETRTIRVVKVPFSRWSDNPGWAGDLEELFSTSSEDVESTQAREPRTPFESGRDVFSGIDSQAWTGVNGIVLLLAEGAATEPVTEFEPALDQLPRPGAGERLGDFSVADDQGTVEVQQRGGRDFVIVRDAHGAVVYEGPMRSENDLLHLRPLRPGLRQVVEDSVGPNRTTRPALSSEVGVVPVPPQWF